MLDHSLDLLPLMSGALNRFPIEGELDISPTEVNNGIVLSGPVRLSGCVENLSGYTRLTLTITAEYDTVCDRCLAPIHACPDIQLQRTVAAAGTLEDEDSYEVDNEYILVEGNRLPLYDIVLETLALELPQWHLCREDCRGLCAKCGHNLNEGDCGCPKKEPDPRLAVLSTLLGNKSE